MTQDLQGELRTFVGDVVRDMGLDANVEVETLEDGSIRVDIRGDGGEVLLRRKGEGLDALQHIVNTAFRRDLDSQRIVIDSLGFRRGKDLELEQMTRFLIDRARSTGTPQELGPLNSYARRVVHMEVAKHADATSESQGDGAVKKVIIAIFPAYLRWIPPPPGFHKF